MTPGNARFTGLTELVESGEIITTDRYLEASRRRKTWTYWKRDFVYHSGRWRGRPVPPLKWMPHRISRKVVILGHSDIATRLNDVAYLRNRGASAVCATNCESVRGNSLALPLGLTNFTRESDRHQILGNQNLLVSANSESFPSKYVGSIFGCFDTRTSIEERDKCARALVGYGEAVIDRPDYSSEGRTRYLVSLRRYDFVACPRGNGVDTHRLWETLYMGGTPIVTSNPMIDELCRDLPVITIPGWDSLPSRDELHEMKEALSRREFQWERLTVSYWISRILDLEKLAMPSSKVASH